LSIKFADWTISNQDIEGKGAALRKTSWN
jgi:hypothetical protein